MVAEDTGGLVLLWRPPVYPRMMNVVVKQTLAWLPGVPI